MKTDLTEIHKTRSNIFWTSAQNLSLRSRYQNTYSSLFYFEPVQIGSLWSTLNINSESCIDCGFLLPEYQTFWICHVMIVGSRIDCTRKNPIDDSRVHVDHVTNSKCEKCLQQKAATNATFRIRFRCLEKTFPVYIAV